MYEYEFAYNIICLICVWILNMTWNMIINSTLFVINIKGNGIKVHWTGRLMTFICIVNSSNSIK